MESQETIRIVHGITKKEEWRLSSPVDFSLLRGEHLAVVGNNGAGKSFFVDMLTGRHPLFPDMVSYDFGDHAHEMVSDNIRFIRFRDTYGGDSDRTFFLQQRWNQMEIDPETPTVRQKLEEAFCLSGADTSERRQQQAKLYELFGITALLDKYIILLSSGELRKYKLVSALFADPRLLIIDNPFIGLDAETRSQLIAFLRLLAQSQQLQLILVLPRSEEIPPFITHVVEVRNMTVLPKQPREAFLSAQLPVATPLLSDQRRQEIMSYTSIYNNKVYDSDEVIAMNQVSISYGSHTILHDLSWTVRRGEHWALSGRNGSGKSTLLSLVCADNPQGYACDIRLFGHQRGCGESIWDIKRHIGYVSPEMVRSYRQNLPAIHVVASGLKDSIGLFVRPNEQERAQCRKCMRLFGIDGLENRPFLQLSNGEQRLLLVARAFVKDPELLILDEPLHGLDPYHRQLVREIIEAFCRRPGKTLIMVTHYEEELPPCINKRLWLEKPSGK